MRAGLLREKIEILEMETTLSETGAEEKRCVATYTIKAYRKKLSAAVGNGVNAHEEFIANTLVFQVRRYSFLNENVLVEYGEQRYKVILLDAQPDHTFLMTCSKTNE